MTVQPEEIEQLYRDRYPVFLGVALSVVTNREGARDVVQEGFARALRSRWTFRGEGSLEAWVWRIVLRAALDTHRRPREEPLHAWQDELQPALPYPERDPELTSALRGLPPRRRLILFLRYFADLSYEEIAEICETSVGTVSSSLVQARSELLDVLTAKDTVDEKETDDERRV
ncbi:MAG: sigma-70 family RNA polymerase sigma factor [Gaiellaceae bacterium]